MKRTALMSLLVLSTPSFAMDAGIYECTVTPKDLIAEKLKFEFEMQSNQELKCYEYFEGGEEFCKTFFKFTPANQAYFDINDLYDGNYGLDDNQNFVVDSDEDGCDIGHLTLYKASNYSTGIISSEFHCSNTEDMSYAGTVQCQKR